MKKILFAILFMVSCADVTSPVKNQQPSSSKEAVILTYSQSVRDSALNGPCPIYSVHSMPLCPGSCDSIKDERMKTFVQNEMGTKSVVLFSNIAGNYQYAISEFPFVFDSTQYYGEDSSRLIIDSINGSSNVYLKTKDKPFILRSGETLVFIDTVYLSNPPCQKRRIITKMLKNAGLDSLPNEKYRTYF